MQAMPTIQSSKINSLSTPTDNLQLNNVVPGSSIPDSSLLDSQTQEAYINGNSIMKPSADTAVSLPLLTKQPQLPAQSNSTMVLLVEDNEINLKVRPKLPYRQNLQ
jgi:hypothetical protein